MPLTPEELEAVAESAAMTVAQQDWHRLNLPQTTLVSILTRGGYLATKPQPDGFVGRYIPREERAKITATATAAG